ncbi:hypothetical protein LFL96_26470 [Paraburkholderia sp. D15]|uniref:hypothetical protein n=1 Tax=Paraburkholderia sp. D15 TaxID=2880218 RepID=UPI0024793798|nr:hypothetical protein [Paraburkholderia sp. D15]WGS54557.1 hypothetical protein LFL96_26470 [Paraburkholderia sp. D15]
MLSTHSASAVDANALLGRELHSEVIRHFTRHPSASPDDAERQLLECLRYLYLISRHRERLSGLFLPVEQQIDEVWHYLILQTREYRTLCEERLPGGFFIEHRSCPYSDYRQTPSREELIEQALRWLPLYRESFGPFDEAALRHWTMPRFLRDELGFSLADIAGVGEVAEVAAFTQPEISRSV